MTDITPDRFKCAISASCPSIRATENNTYIIVGKFRSEAAVSVSVDEDEMAVEVPAELIDEAILNKKSDNINDFLQQRAELAYADCYTLLKELKHKLDQLSK